MRTLRLCFLIRKLNYGGAQRQLITLANGLAGHGHAIRVIVFYPGGELEEFLSPTVNLVIMNKRGRWDILGFFFRLVRVIRVIKPEVIYSFLEDSNLISAGLKLTFPGIHIFWGIRHSFLDLSKYDLATWANQLIEQRLARFVDQIIFNSHAGMVFALVKRFPAGKSRVIPNGIDTNYFGPDPMSREQTRKGWGISHDDRLIGIVGRLDPMKDHPTFLSAASRLVTFDARMRFIIVGDGPKYSKQELKRLSCRLGLEDNLIWAGNRMDMPSVYNALDILVSSSYGEGFSNAVGEAMACGVPCVVTDVGDSAQIVGDTGVVVPPHNPQALANGIEEMLSRLEMIDHQRIRSHIVKNFSVDILVARTENALSELIVS